MTVRVISPNKQQHMLPDTIFLRFLAISLILHGLLICIVCHQNDIFRQKLLSRIRNVVPVQLILYQRKDIPEAHLIKKKILPEKEKTSQAVQVSGNQKNMAFLSVKENYPVAVKEKNEKKSRQKPLKPVQADRFDKKRQISTSVHKDREFIPLPTDIYSQNKNDIHIPKVKQKADKAGSEEKQSAPSEVGRKRTKESASLKNHKKYVLQKRENPSPVSENPVKQTTPPTMITPVTSGSVKLTEIPVPSSDSSISGSLPAYSSEAKNIVQKAEAEAQVSDFKPTSPIRVEESPSISMGNGAEKINSSSVKQKPSINDNPGKKGREKDETDTGEMRRRLAEFRGTVAGRIESVKVYPHEARQERQEGKVVISFIIDPGGNIGKVNIVSSSGFHLLDKAASEAVEAGAPYLPFPEGLGKPVRIKMIVNFKIS